MMCSCVAIEEVFKGYLPEEANLEQIEVQEDLTYRRIRVRLGFVYADLSFLVAGRRGPPPSPPSPFKRIPVLSSPRRLSRFRLSSSGVRPSAVCPSFSVARRRSSRAPPPFQPSPSLGKAAVVVAVAVAVLVRPIAAVGTRRSAIAVDNPKVAAAPSSSPSSSVPPPPPFWSPACSPCCPLRPGALRLCPLRRRSPASVRRPSRPRRRAAAAVGDVSPGVQPWPSAVSRRGPDRSRPSDLDRIDLGRPFA
ncbi:hypothetical protein MLD38_040459 [Melastoma candidum]|nr:hypothetical protein MLD38_040459 [Melastoma candidum]